MFVIGDALTTVGFASVFSMATDVFRFLGHWLPLQPFPLGAVACAYFVKLGALLVFLNQVTSFHTSWRLLLNVHRCLKLSN